MLSAEEERTLREDVEGRIADGDGSLIDYSANRIAALFATLDDSRRDAKLRAYAKARDVLVNLIHEWDARQETLEFGLEALRRLYREFYDESGR